MSGGRDFYQQLVETLSTELEEEELFGYVISGEPSVTYGESKSKDSVPSLKVVDSKPGIASRVAPKPQTDQKIISKKQERRVLDYKKWQNLFEHNPEFKDLVEDKKSGIQELRKVLEDGLRDDGLEDDDINLSLVLGRDLAVELQLMQAAIAFGRYNNSYPDIHTHFFEQFKDFVLRYAKEKNQSSYQKKVKKFLERVMKLDYAVMHNNNDYVNAVYHLLNVQPFKNRSETTLLDLVSIRDLDRIGNEPLINYINSLDSGDVVVEDNSMTHAVESHDNVLKVRFYFQFLWQIMRERLKVATNDISDPELTSFIEEQDKKFLKFLSQANPNPEELRIFLETMLYVSRAYVGLSLLKVNPSATQSLKKIAKEQIYHQAEKEIKKILQSDALTYQDVASLAILNAGKAFEMTNQDTVHQMMKSANDLASLDHYLAPWFMIGAGVLLMALGYGLGTNTFGLSAYFATKYAMPLIIAGLSSFSMGATVKTFQFFSQSLTKDIYKAETSLILPIPRN